MRVYSLQKVFGHCDLYYLEFDDKYMMNYVTFCYKLTYVAFKEMNLSVDTIVCFLRDGCSSTKYGYVLDLCCDKISEYSLYIRLINFKNQFERNSKIDNIVDG